MTTATTVLLLFLVSVFCKAGVLSQQQDRPKPKWVTLAYESDEELTGSSEETSFFRGLRHSNNCSCGWTNKERIVGGKEANKHQFPFIAGLVITFMKKVYCGATIVTTKHALTASHCTVPTRGFPLAIVIGAHDLKAEKDASDFVPVAETVEHENYTSVTSRNDIALLVLKRDIRFNRYVGPACIPSNFIPLDDENVKVIGWGLKKYRGEASDVLKHLNLKVFPLIACAARYKSRIDPLNPTQICTFRRNQDSCQGDSGGPLVWLDPDTNRYTLVALVSYGSICGSNAPSVNTQISSFLPWIQAKIAETGGGTTCAKV